MSNQNNVKRITSKEWRLMVSECLDQTERTALYQRFNRKEIIIDDSNVKEPRERISAYKWALRLRSVSDEERQKLRAAEASGEIEVIPPHDPYLWANNAKKREEALRARAEKEAREREQNAS